MLVGGGTGFVTAAAEDPVPAAMAFPRPGASASYSVEEFHVGEAQGELPVDSFTMTWMPELWIADQDFNLRLVHPLRTEFRAVSQTQIREAYFDAATGEPVLTSGSGTFYADGGVDCDGQSDCSYRYDVYKGRGGPCGARNALQDGQDLERPLRMTGYCDYVDGQDEMTYHFAGHERLGAYDTVRFQDPERREFQAWFAQSLPFPVRFTTTFSDEIYYGFLGHERMYDVRLFDYTEGSGTYARPVHSAVLPGPGALPLAPRLPLLFDFDGFPATFRFEDAYAAAASDTSDAGLAEFLRTHPTAYVAEASSQEMQREDGTVEPSWYFIVTDGYAWKSVAVRQGPLQTYVLGMPVTAPQETGTQTWVESWPLSTEATQERNRGRFYPTPDHLPDFLPHPADILERQRFVENRDLPDARYFGWSLRCENPACIELAAEVAAGLQVQRQSSPVVPGLFGGTSGGDLAMLVVDEHGQPVRRWAFTYDRPTYQVVGSSDKDGFDLAPNQVYRATGVWQVPGAAAATGLSLVALAASALYYFWPALKGMAGLGLFSRIDSDRVLDHPARKTLYHLIEANPGVHFQDLGRRVGFGRGQLDHHLNKILQARLVTRVQGQGYTCYFVRGQVNRSVMDAAPLLRSEGGRSVLQTLHQRPGLSTRDLAGQLGLAPGTVAYHVKRLREAGFLTSQAGSLHLTDTGQQVAGFAA